MTHHAAYLDEAANRAAQIGPDGYRRFGSFDEAVEYFRSLYFSPVDANRLAGALWIPEWETKGGEMKTGTCR